jgi:hypothetical protein
MAKDSAPTVAMPSEMSSHRSVTVRRIDNGYVRHVSHSEGGEYHSKETYHRKRPSASLGSGREAEPDCTGSCGLAGAKPHV